MASVELRPERLGATVVTAANSDHKGNTVSGVTGPCTTRPITSDNTGQNYVLAWIDDRVGAHNWHLYHRAYKYDVSGQPVATDLKVNGGSIPVAQDVALAGHPTQANLAYYDSLVAWHDERLNPTVNQRVYFKYVGSDGYMPWPDQRADTHATNINATYPEITWQQNLGFAVAWQAERTAGSTLYDILARFYNSSGSPIGTDCCAGGVQCKLNASTADATTPTVASDASSNGFVAREQFDTRSNGSIMLRKSDPTGTTIATIQVNTLTSPPTEGHEVALATSNARWCSVANRTCTTSADCPGGRTCDACTVIAPWLERQCDGTQPDGIYRRMFWNNATLSPIENQVLVSASPGLPLGPNVRPASAWPPIPTTTSSHVDRHSQRCRGKNWNVFARGFSPAGTALGESSTRSVGSSDRLPRRVRPRLEGSNRNPDRVLPSLLPHDVRGVPTPWSDPAANVAPAAHSSVA